MEGKFSSMVLRHLIPSLSKNSLHYKLAHIVPVGIEIIFPEWPQPEFQNHHHNDTCNVPGSD
jgi:hypothetical protein